MFKKIKNQGKIKVDFANGLACFGNKQKKLFVDYYGVYFKKFFKKVYLCVDNCEVL